MPGMPVDRRGAGGVDGDLDRLGALLLVGVEHDWRGIESSHSFDLRHHLFVSKVRDMIFSALFSFLASSAFRMIWGEVASWLNKNQEHKHEIERLTLQKELDAAAHDREITVMQVQHNLGIRT